MDINSYFSDFDPAATAAAERSAHEQLQMAQDTHSATPAMILDSSAFSEEHVVGSVPDFLDYIADRDTTADGVVGATPIEAVAPQHMDTLTDGREVLVIGDTERYGDFNHKQGDNELGFKQDCGLVSSQEVLNQFDIPVTENDVVNHAVDNNQCAVVPSDASQSGGTSADGQAHVLSDYGVPAHVENNGNLDELATNIQDGHGVIIEVNAGILWDDANSYEDGGSNHAITVTGVVRDPSTSEITGFIVNDSGDGKGEKFVDAATVQQMWVDTGGQSVVTDVTH